ncbi:hypothetical protein BCR37DRAFT_378623 [Protomyces lactucae-debilis]|uniref:Uncharacterized protein n=1 Tax=Protomyces lactucae-debilis TaxID=2754530 RepID=A0A1Y2FI88_PROLT|nr:uncharacterized protein BCR37DRAFT_378623 [Protomyces lactucae-debilis]ORY83661.1 hypothetical protein BCR37DRAFT_378623 [Protomyces lactucae-debilis]
MRSPDITYLALMLLQAVTVAGDFPQCDGVTGAYFFLTTQWTNLFGFYGKHCTDQCKTLFEKGLQSAGIPQNKVSFCQENKSKAVVRVTWNFIKNGQARDRKGVDVCVCDYEISLKQLAPPEKCDRSKIKQLLSDHMEHASDDETVGECQPKELGKTNGRQFLLYYSGW